MFDSGGGEGGRYCYEKGEIKQNQHFRGPNVWSIYKPNYEIELNEWTLDVVLFFLLMQSKVQRYWYGECPSLLKFCKLHFVPVSSNHWKLPLKVNPNNPKSKKEKLKNIAYPWKGNLPLFFQWRWNVSDFSYVSCKPFNSQKWLTYNFSQWYPQVFWQTVNENTQTYQEEVFNLDLTSNSHN